MIKKIEIITEKDIPVEHLLSDRFIKGRGKWDDGTEFYAVKEKVVEELEVKANWVSSSVK